MSKSERIADGSGQVNMFGISRILVGEVLIKRQLFPSCRHPYLRCSGWPWHNQKSEIEKNDSIGLWINRHSLSASIGWIIYSLVILLRRFYNNKTINRLRFGGFIGEVTFSIQVINSLCGSTRRFGFNQSSFSTEYWCFIQWNYIYHTSSAHQK